MRFVILFLILMCSPALAIVEGSRVSAGSALSKGVVFVFSPKGEGCSGTLIARDTVLTAGHCIKGGKLLVFLKQGDGARTVLEVKAAARHPNYRDFKQGDKSFPLDLGVIVLKNPAPEGYEPIALMTGTKGGDRLTIAGWGRQTPEKGAVFGVLKSAALIGIEQSSKNFLALVDPYTMGKALGSGACFGDSGGPAIFNGGVAGVLIMSSGEGTKGCGLHSLIVKVDDYVGWINATMKRLGGGR